MAQVYATQYRTVLERFLLKLSFVFTLLFINSFSFPHPYIPDVGKYTHTFFEAIVKWSAKNIFHIHHHYTSKLISDSTGFYINAFDLLIISFLAAIVWSIADKNKRNYHVLAYWFKVIISYYLALQLFTYGFSKIFKWQFYLPEPNTLFTTIGNTSGDLLYWSTMGASRSYTMFTGILEVVSACLLLYKKTRTFGALMAIAIITNIVMINFSFDISVKLYSCFLLLLSFIVAAAGLKMLYHAFVLNKGIYKPWKPNYSSKKIYWLYVVCKIFVIGFILFDVLSLYFKTKNYNDDAAERPFLHGAYDVITFVKNNDTLPPLLTDNHRWKRMFIHRRGYLITQLMNDDMQDYNLEYDTSQNQLLINKYADSSQTILHYQLFTDSTLMLFGVMDEDSVRIQLKKIDLQKLPLLKKEFHWTIDE